ncbi:MAG: HAMP domain-containing histidine kinase [Flavobacteriales bacterium]|nr:HAMP domain-containing histidine kinase [Flavobacteriales bacterium]
MNAFKFNRIIKPILLLFALTIAIVSLWYTNNLAKKIELEEDLKIKNWAKATSHLATSDFSEDLTFFLEIVNQNTTIPVILTDELDNITTWRNVDSAKAMKDPNYLVDKLRDMKEEHEPIVLNYFEGKKLKVYYENSIILTRLKYYPYIQLLIISFFLTVSYLAFSYSRKSEQNLVWVGMSKETAHQLGTPLSSLLAWIEIIKSEEGINKSITDEMEKDLNRLQIITERFSKIGSDPVLEPLNLVNEIEKSIDYLKSRTSSRVVFNIDNRLNENYLILLNPYLFAWAMENLIKNAIDAMDGKGTINILLYYKNDKIYMELSDSGKGIPPGRFGSIFKPGFTTKKRGWGLGLSFVKRIIENYHNGSIQVKESIVGKGTTFKITFPVFRFKLRSNF